MMHLTSIIWDRLYFTAVNNDKWWRTSTEINMATIFQWTCIWYLESGPHWAFEVNYNLTRSHLLWIETFEIGL